MNTPVHVEGYRQTGKTEMLLDHAVMQAARGRRVYYRTHDARMARYTLERAYQIASSIGIAIPLIHYGRSMIQFPSSGLLWVWTGGSPGADRGMQPPHLEIHDEVAMPWHPGAQYRIHTPADLNPPLLQGVPSNVADHPAADPERRIM